MIFVPASPKYMRSAVLTFRSEMPMFLGAPTMRKTTFRQPDAGAGSSAQI